MSTPTPSEPRQVTQPKALSEHDLDAGYARLAAAFNSAAASADRRAARNRYARRSDAHLWTVNLLVLAVLAAIVVVIVLAVQRQQPRTLFTTPVGRQCSSDVGAVQQWVALHDHALAHGLCLLSVQRVYKRQRNGRNAQVSIYDDSGSTMRMPGLGGPR